MMLLPPKKLATESLIISDDSDDSTMDPGYEPTSVDIVCARGRSVYNHEGNQRFRGILKDNLEKYKSATTKQQKTMVVNALLDEIKEGSRFVRKLADGKWVEVAEHVAKEKIGQGFRDLLHTEYRSSTKSKVKLRRERRRRMKNIEERGSPDPEGSISRKGHRSTNSSEFFEPLPLDESAEALLYECEFSFEGKEEDRAVGADGEKVAMNEELRKDPEVQGPNDEKIGTEEHIDGVEVAPPPRPGDTVESSSVSVPTFVSPASPAPQPGRPRNYHSPRHHDHPPYRPHYPEPASSPSDFRHYQYPPWRHHSPPGDYRPPYYPPPPPPHPHSPQPSSPHRHSPRRQQTGAGVSPPPPPPPQYYPPPHSHSPHPPLPHPHSPHETPYSYPAHYYHGPHWSDYHPSYHPQPPAGQHESSAADYHREDHGRGNEDHRYRHYYPPDNRHHYGPPR